MLIPATAGKGSTWLSHGTLPKSSVPDKTVIQVTVFLQDMLVWVKMVFFQLLARRGLSPWCPHKAGLCSRCRQGGGMGTRAGRADPSWLHVFAISFHQWINM